MKFFEFIKKFWKILLAVVSTVLMILLALIGINLFRNYHKEEEKEDLINQNKETEDKLKAQQIKTEGRIKENEEVINNTNSDLAKLNSLRRRKKFTGKNH